MIEYLMMALAVLLVLWAHELNRCEECGDQLLWADPERSDVPLTRCFTCEGEHYAYIQKEYHDQYDFRMANDEHYN